MQTGQPRTSFRAGFVFSPLQLPFKSKRSTISNVMNTQPTPKVCNKECKFCISRIMEDLKEIESGEDQLQYIVDLVKDIPCLNEEFKCDDFKVKGCMSNLWLVPEMKDGKCYFYCDGDAVIPKGIAFIISALHSGYTPEEVLSLDLSCIKKLGLEKYLSPNRRNSVSNLSTTIQEYAKKFLNDRGCEKCPKLHII